MRFPTKNVFFQIYSRPCSLSEKVQYTRLYSVPASKSMFQQKFRSSSVFGKQFLPELEAIVGCNKQEEGSWNQLEHPGQQRTAKWVVELNNSVLEKETNIFVIIIVVLSLLTGVSISKILLGNSLCIWWTWIEMLYTVNSRIQYSPHRV